MEEYFGGNWEQLLRKRYRAKRQQIINSTKEIANKVVIEVVGDIVDIVDDKAVDKNLIKEVDSENNVDVSEPKIKRDIGEPLVDNHNNYLLEESSMDIICDGDKTPIPTNTVAEELPSQELFTDQVVDVAFVDFLGVEQFEWAYNVRLVNLVNKLKDEERRTLHQIFSVGYFRPAIKG